MLTKHEETYSPYASTETIITTFRTTIFETATASASPQITTTSTTSKAFSKND
jgi:hypothetical protein